MKNIIILLIFCTIIAIIGYISKNQKYFLEIKDKYFNKKFYKILILLIEIFIILLIIMFIYINIKKIIRFTQKYEISQEDTNMFKDYDERIIKEQKFLKSVIEDNIYEGKNYNNPYILEGFEYVEGEWNTGYVIQDENKNQYVWVPCTNRENKDGVPVLEKINLDNPAFISKDTCIDESYEKFITSAIKNGGFYVSRFEIGKENEIPVSKYGVEIWNNLTRKEAIEVINTMYLNKDFNCELINGLAYDTMMSYVLKNNSKEIVERNFTENNCYSGNKKYNNIYDIMDNSMELTNETLYETIIIRGMCNNDEYEFCNRYNILEEEKEYIYNSLISFRTMIYK